jgi:uncharacterized protein GlcG (DUF336 family)
MSARRPRTVIEGNAMIRPRALVIPLLAAALLAACKQHKQASNLEESQGASAVTVLGAASAVERYGENAGGGCKDVPDTAALQRWLSTAPSQGEVGGFAKGRNEWAAVVDREGHLCALAVTTTDHAAAWPGSRAIAEAKAFTANGFSSDAVPMSTARLYTMSLPGHSLWGSGAGNPLNPRCLQAPSASAPIGEVCGGTIAFGGGLPLYKGQTRVGGLGVSGDTPCADHEIAKRVRKSAQLEPAAGGQADDIIYPNVDGPSAQAHPLCANTWRNGTYIGEEGMQAPAGAPAAFSAAPSAASAASASAKARAGSAAG